MPGSSLSCLLVVNIYRPWEGGSVRSEAEYLLLRCVLRTVKPGGGVASALKASPRLPWRVFVSQVCAQQTFMRILAETVFVRWGIGEATNTTAVKATSPSMILYPDSPTPRTFLRPDPWDVAPSSAEFGFRITYLPFGMPEQQWLLLPP